VTKIRIGIVGYGNLGRGAELAIRQNEDMELIAIFTRRPVETVKPVDGDLPVIHLDHVKEWKDKIDVMILCGGSATDLPVMGPQLAADFNIIDSYDNHNKIPEYYSNVDKAAKAGGTLGIISVGWDPGLFSINRLFGEVVLPKGETYTFWGKGVSQGHSDAIRRIDGVKHAVQYTIPLESAVEKARKGAGGNLTTRDKHFRDCYVVAKEGASLELIEETIVNMPSYFADYDTKVTFITEEALKANHYKMGHGGFVIRSGETGLENNRQIMEYSLVEDSNPEFTSSVLVCYARAAYRLREKGRTGAKTVLDIAPARVRVPPPLTIPPERLILLPFFVRVLFAAPTKMI
jgi:diaminopimelate dehydrogenase